VNLIRPGHAVIGEMEAALLLEINRRSDHRRQRDDYQQGADELLLEFPHTKSSDTSPHFRLHVKDHPKFSFLLLILRPFYDKSQGAYDL